MNRVAVCVNRRFADIAEFVRPVVRFDKRLRSARDRFVKSVVGIFDQKSNIAHAVAVLFDMFGRGMFCQSRSASVPMSVLGVTPNTIQPCGPARPHFTRLLPTSTTSTRLITS